MDETHRRSVLRAVTAAATAAIAGCGASDETPTATPTDSATPTDTPTPTDSPTPTVTPDGSLAIARETVAAMAAGEFERARERFGEQLAGAVPTERLRRLWAGMEAQHGAFETIADARTGTFDGTEAQLVTTACAQASADWALVVEDETVTGLRVAAEYSPPAYADQSAFTEREVSVGDGDRTLGGTLSLPADGDSVPGVVLVQGSGASDRNETIGPNEPFRDLAWGLASRGIAVLRYDKRTYAREVPTADRTLDAVTVTDAVSAVDRLGAVERVDPDRRVVVGHSVGATATPRILDRTDAAGGAMLAGNVTPIDELLLEQVRHNSSVVGELTDAEQAQIDQLASLLDRATAGELPDGRLVGGFPAVWWESMAGYDQVETARAIDDPLWIVQGDRDYQIPADTELPGWRSALSDRSATGFRLFEGLSHLFHPGTAPSLGEEYAFHDNVARPVVEGLADWVRTL